MWCRCVCEVNVVRSTCLWDQCVCQYFGYPRQWLRCGLAFQKCAICAILLHGENIWNPGIFVKITFTRKKQTMRNHDWPKFPRDMWCSVAFLWGYHSFPLLLCEVSGGVIRGCTMFPRICYPMFWGYQFISPGFWGGFGDIKCEKPVRGKIRKMSFRQNDCTGKKTFWKASVYPFKVQI